MGTSVSAPKQVIREMAQNGFITDVEYWLLVIDKRNLSTHIDNENLAEEVYAFACDFYPQAMMLLNTLKSL